MSRSRWITAALCALPALPPLAAEPAPAAACMQIEAEIARSQEARRAAVEQSDTAWKAVVPFVVLARKASAKSALDEAEKKLAALQAQAAQCEAPRDDG
jgi:hypothetical protein